MWDLAIAAAVLAAGSLFALGFGLRVTRKWSRQGTFGMSLAVLAALMLFVFRFHGTWQMARLVPFSGAIILANWIPIGGAYFAGVTLGQKGSPPWRRGILAGMILLVSVYSVLCSFQGLLPQTPPTRQPVAVSPQSLPSSCGPCCAAMLLRQHGIDATEREMLGLCLTSYRGCPALGLYRGLKLKTADTDWEVEVVTCTVEELVAMPGPLLLRIEIPPMVVSHHSRTTKERRSYQHVVLLLGAVDRCHVRVMDPAIPLESRRCWRTEDLNEMWSGEAIRLVPRRDRLQKD